MKPSLRAVAAILATWTLLLLGAASAPHIGREPALFGSFVLAIAGLLATREPGRRRATPLGSWLLGLLSGLIAYPLWMAAIGSVGLAIGLAPDPVRPFSGGFLALLAILGLGPLFEELLYRERVLNALEVLRVPLAVRVVLGSLLFAIPHVAPWAVLGTLMVGLALGLTYEATHCLGFCIALHAGLNLASVLPPFPPAGLPFASIALATFAWGLWLARQSHTGTEDAVSAA